MSTCPCGSGLGLESCCQPYINGDKPAPTAEALMRSRYVAYTQGAIEYLKNTLSKAQQIDFDMTGEDASSTKWQSLDIRSTKGGLEKDDHGEVEFIARYKAAGEQHAHHELSYFGREDGRWVYMDAVFNPKSAPVTSVKVGRNDPCPCGSGKKFKKCCG